MAQGTGCETDLSTTPSSAELKNEWSIPSLVVQKPAHISTDVRSPVGTSGDQHSANHVDYGSPVTTHPHRYVSAHIIFTSPTRGAQIYGRGTVGPFLASVIHFSSVKSHPLFPPGADVTCLEVLLINSAHTSKNSVILDTKAVCSSETSEALNKTAV